MFNGKKGIAGRAALITFLIDCCYYINLSLSLLDICGI
jgi:hypothetical protein